MKPAAKSPATASEEEAPVTPVEPPAEPATTEIAPAETPEPAEEKEETEAAETPAQPAEPEAEPSAAAAAPQRLTAFDRTALRMLGKGDLVARVERAEGDVACLTAENTRLAAELAKLQAEMPKQIAAAAQGRKDDVAKGVAAELQTLGIKPEQAPGQMSAQEADNSMTFAEFQALSHEKRNEFMRNGGKIAN